MASEYNKDAVRRLIEHGFNGRDMAEFDRFFAIDHVNHELPADLPPGVEGMKRFAGVFINAFPDMQLIVDDLLAEGDRTVLRWSATGIHRGNLMGIPPTGKRVTITGIAIDRFENGQSAEQWQIFDELGLMHQLGVVPAN